MTLALLVVDNFLIGYKLYILICARHLKSRGKEVVLRLLPSLFTKAKLHRFWRKHSILEWSEPFMIFFFKSKHSINVLNVKVELMTSNPALYVILFEWCTSVKFSNQRITNSGEFAKKFIPAPFLKTTRNEGILKIINIHLSFLNDWSCFELKGISFKILRGVKQSSWCFLLSPCWTTIFCGVIYKT